MHALDRTGDRARGQRAFTLIEVMIALGVIAIFAAMAVPSMGRWVDDQRVKSSARSAADLFTLARSESIRLGRSHLVCFQTQQNLGALTNVSGGVPIANVVQDDDGAGPLPAPNGVIDGGERVVDLRAQPGLNWGVTWATAAAPLDPDPGGTFATGLTFRRPSNAPARCIAYAPDGTPRGFDVGPYALGIVGSGAGALYVTNGNRDYAVVLSPLGGVRIHAWDRASNQWRN